MTILEQNSKHFFFVWSSKLNVESSLKRLKLVWSIGFWLDQDCLTSDAYFFKASTILSQDITRLCEGDKRKKSVVIGFVFSQELSRWLLNWSVFWFLLDFLQLLHFFPYQASWLLSCSGKSSYLVGRFVFDLAKIALCQTTAFL